MECVRVILNQPCHWNPENQHSGLWTCPSISMCIFLCWIYPPGPDTWCLASHVCCSRGSCDNWWLTPTCICRHQYHCQHLTEKQISPLFSSCSQSNQNYCKIDIQGFQQLLFFYLDVVNWPKVDKIWALSGWWLTTGSLSDGMMHIVKTLITMAMVVWYYHPSQSMIIQCITDNVWKCLLYESQSPTENRRYVWYNV